MPSRHFFDKKSLECFANGGKVKIEAVGVGS